VLAGTQRLSLLEDSVREASSSQRDGVAALRLDEIELLLTLAQQRLQLAGDLPGAVRATELAEGVLSSQHDPALLNLRQTLAQELTALRAMPKNPAAIAAGELDALEAVLPLAMGARRRAALNRPPPSGSGLQRLLIAGVRSTGARDLLSPADQQAGGAALAQELALARSALASADEHAFRNSVARIDGWLLRLYPDGPLLRERRQHLKTLRALPLSYELPIAGSTLQQLQDLRRSRQGRP
jgi:uroporphyrin-3 C-methyltransferase